MCSHCKGSILHVHTDKLILEMDAEPSDQGQWILTWAKKDNRLLAKHISRVPPHELTGRKRYTYHADTCYRRPR